MIVNESGIVVKELTREEMHQFVKESIKEFASELAGRINDEVRFDSDEVLYSVTKALHKIVNNE